MRRPVTAKMKAQGAKGVAAYLATLPPADRAALEKLRAAIRAAAPDAEEGFSYSLPTFKLDGRAMVCYDAPKNHCSFYPMSAAVMKDFAEELEKYDTSKGTIRFPATKPLPATLVKKIVRARVAEISKKKAK